MQVIPSINVKTFEEAKRLIEKAAEFCHWVHIDVADGIFTPNISWGNPKELGEFRNLNFETHLMVENPEMKIRPWLEAGAKRIILHLELIKKLGEALNICNQFGAELGVAFSPEIDISQVKDQGLRIKDINFFQVLAVKLGLAGQKFQPEALEKIRLLRRQRPDAIIEMDGGINLETAKMAKEAGADIIVSAFYIWSSPEPGKAFEELIEI